MGNLTLRRSAAGRPRTLRSASLLPGGGHPRHPDRGEHVGEGVGDDGGGDAIGRERADDHPDAPGQLVNPGVDELGQAGYPGHDPRLAGAPGGSPPPPAAPPARGSATCHGRGPASSGGGRTGGDPSSFSIKDSWASRSRCTRHPDGDPRCHSYQVVPSRMAGRSPIQPPMARSVTASLWSIIPGGIIQLSRSRARQAPVRG